MKCPTCGQNTPDDWQPLYIRAPRGPGFITELKGQSLPSEPAEPVTLDYMLCANKECGELVIRVHEHRVRVVDGAIDMVETDSWLAHPRASRQPIDPAITGEFRRDYEEAAVILDPSPRMSAVLSRRILGDLLERYAGQNSFSLTTRIDNFIKDTKHPHYLRENLHHFREIADFGAHTQRNHQAEIINVDRDEAEWTLDLVDRLFEYFIIGPQRDQKMRAAMDAKVKDAGRKPIPPLADKGGA
jgi:hypothetical protein